MTAKPARSSAKSSGRRKAAAREPLAVDQVIAELRSLGSDAARTGYARYGIAPAKAFGMSMKDIQRIGKRIGKDHALAGALWETGWYEARLLAAYVADPSLVTASQMDRWCRDFDNWGVCDTLCFVLFDRTRDTWSRIPKWAASEQEFVRRGAFALFASLAGHDKKAADERFLELLPLAETAAADGRNFVKKAVSWALRRTGGRSARLHAECLAVARRLAASSSDSSRWIGRDVTRDLERPIVLDRVKRAEKRTRARS